MNPAFVQTAANRLCVMYSNAQIVLRDWRNSALKERQLDPAHIVIELRKTGAACYAAANLIEDEIKKIAA